MEEQPPDDTSPPGAESTTESSEVSEALHHGRAVPRQEDCTKEIDSSSAPKRTFLNILPPELISSIFDYLSPTQLALVAPTCRAIHDVATADHIWQRRVQENVPGVKVTSSYPCASFRELYAAHDPRWFLPKYKLWFSGRRLTGKLIVVRYDPRRGVIEGYHLLAISDSTTMEPWSTDADVSIHTFHPKVKLHLDKPVLELRADPPDPPAPRSRSKPELEAGRFGVGTRLSGTGGAVFNDLVLARPLPADDAARRLGAGQLYHNLWPAPAVPAPHRVFDGDTSECRLAPRPSCRAEISDRAFYLLQWRELVPPPSALALVAMGSYDGPLLPPVDEDEAAAEAAAEARGEKHIPNPARLPRFIMPMEVDAFATLDPALYTPTADKPWRGIWVGDYSRHGCEFLLIHQPDDEEPFDEAALVRDEDESAEDFARRKKDARLYRGRLEAIKLTGDPNVPRGEYTFVVDDLGEAGFVTVVKEEPFAGTRVVKSRGHIADHGFLDDTYIDSQLLLVSHDRLAQYWVGFAHISFFERVDIDQFLVP